MAKHPNTVNAAETDIVQGLHTTEPQTGAVMPPIYPATTFARGPDNALINDAHIYTRDQNPTYRLPESMLARLENGNDALLFSSGMAAGCAVFRAMKPGDEILVPDQMYYGLRDWVRHFAETWGLSLRVYSVADPNAIRRAVTSDTQLVWAESPTNPTWEVTDIADAAAAAHDVGALLAVDSTVATPVHCRPLDLGADLVMHSATKALNGHSDVLAGVLVVKDPSLAVWQTIAKERGESGAIPGPFEAWLLQRGMRTLFVRVMRASQSALTIAQHFENHPALAAVLYPGLPSSPGHDIAARQMRDGYGAMLSFRFRGGEQAALEAISRLRVFTRATSLGGVESLVEHRATAEGASSEVPPDLLRFSVGIERCEDLVNDLDNAIAGL